MKFTSLTLAAVTVLGAASVVSAFVPAHLDYLTYEELEAASASASNRLLVDKTGKGIGFTESVVEVVVVDEEEEEEISPSESTDDISTETEDIFDAASGGATSEENQATFLNFDSTPSGPIMFSQFSSDTCDESNTLYTGEINSIQLLSFGEFCITDTINLGVNGTALSYTKLTNNDCSLFGVVDTYADCSNEDCSECNDDDNYLSITAWDEVFPNPFSEHCFQTSYATDSEDFDNGTLNIDYQFSLDSTENGLAYKTFIVINSCVKDFVSSDNTEFTTESVKVTEEDGTSATISEEGVLLESNDGSGSNIAINEGGVTLDDGSGSALVIEDGVASATDDGGLIIESDEVLIVASADGGFIAITDNSLTIGDTEAYISVTESSITFGDSNEQSNKFTLVDVHVDVGDELEYISIMFKDSDGSLTFYNDSVVFSGVEGDFTVLDPVYSYTEDGAFTIVGDTEDGEKFGLGFNNEGAIFGIEDSFLAGFDTTTMSGFFVNDDQLILGNASGIVNVTEGTDPDSDDDYVVDVISSAECLSIPDVLCTSDSAGNFTVLCDFWSDNNIAELFKGQSLTIFAPTDTAFDNLFAVLKETNTEVDDDTLGEIFLFHAALGMVTSSDLVCGGLIEMVGGGSSRTECAKSDDGIDYFIQKGGGNRKNNIDPIIIAADITACDDSVIHVITEVMLPNFIGELM